MTRQIAGADGCRSGWVIVHEHLAEGNITWEVVPSIRELLERDGGPDILALDIPIGLPDAGARVCDEEARTLLGPGRASSVFPVPIRPVLAAAILRGRMRHPCCS